MDAAERDSLVNCMLHLYLSLGGVYVLKVTTSSIQLATTLLITTPRGPDLFFPPENIYTNVDLQAEHPKPRTANTSGQNSGSIWSQCFFSYPGIGAFLVQLSSRRSQSLNIHPSTVIETCNTLSTFSILDLPILPAHLRALPLYQKMRKIYGSSHEQRSRLDGTGWLLLGRIYRANAGAFAIQALLSTTTAGRESSRSPSLCSRCIADILKLCYLTVYYGPAFLLKKLVEYVEADPARDRPKTGSTLALAFFLLAAVNYIYGVRLTFDRTASEWLHADVKSL